MAVRELDLAVHAGEYYLSQPITQTLIADYLEHRGRADVKDPLELLS